MKAYPEYRESGFDWIGKYPSHWTFCSLGYKSRMIVPMRDKPQEFDGDIPWIRIEDFNGKYISGSKSDQKVSETTVADMNLKVFPVGTVLCSCSCRMGATAIVSQPLISNQTFIGIVPAEDLFSDYLYYLVQAAKPTLDSLGTGAIQKYLSRNDFEHFKVAFPSLPEQRAIADFLDRKTAQIDTLIEKKQRQIDLLQEQRTALINHAVTKGLNPDVRMKDSGVEWLGEIPSHWKMKRIKHSIQSKKNSIKTGPFGSQLTNADMAGTDVKVYNQRSVIDNDFVNGENYVSLEKFQQLKEFEIFAGDILITTRGTIGRCAIFPENAEKGILHPCLIRLQMNEELILKEYLIGFIQDSVLFKQSIFFESNATTIEVIYSGTMKQVPVPVPPVEEQQIIIKYLSDLKNKVQLATEKLDKEIMLLQEYRTALISEAVTGKIDVRTAV